MIGVSKLHWNGLSAHVDTKARWVVEFPENSNSNLELPSIHAKLAARKIFESTDQKISLLLSGGIDSEAMAEAFCAAKIPFEAHIFSFEDQLNLFDIENAVRYCLRNSISYKVHEFRIFDFLNSDELPRIAVEYQTNSPQLATHLKMLESIPGFYVMPWNPPPLFYNRVDESYSILGPPQKYFSFLRWQEKNQRQGCPFFFLSTPDLIYSFIYQNFTQDLLFRPRVMRSLYHLKAYEIKCLQYQFGGFSATRKPDKWTGFERVKDFVQSYFKSDGWEFERRYRWPLEKIVKLDHPLVTKFGSSLSVSSNTD